jgi:CDP-glucose 4,6-dehydratase
MFNNVYKNKKVLVTGHTGFKGSWLVLWLKMMGAEVAGISLPPDSHPNHWTLLENDIDSYFIDIRDKNKLQNKILEINPEIIFHLAAQSLVQRSYIQSAETWETNVMGTVNLLEACLKVEKLIAVVIITSDKCYDNKEWIWGYREIDAIGGRDPYSASKGVTELVVDSYRHSFFNKEKSPLVATARAGNVIGGGDWSADRLIPDLIRALERNEILQIRSPRATRPWQHVLDCLSGYLLLGEQLLKKNSAAAGAWNFGPNSDANLQVDQVLVLIKEKWPEIEWSLDMAEKKQYESQLLYLDSSKSRKLLFWTPVLSIYESINMTLDWYSALIKKSHIESLDQLDQYMNLAKQRKVIWST